MSEFYEALPDDLKQVHKKLHHNWAREMLEMWYFHRPDLVEQMYRDGTLAQTLNQRAAQSVEMYLDLTESGRHSHEQALDVVKADWPLPDPEPTPQ